MAAHAELVSDLKALRKGRGLYVNNVGDRVGHTLRDLCGVTEQDGPGEIRAIGSRSGSRSWPATCRTICGMAVLAAFGMIPDARHPLYQERVDWIAQQIGRDPRTARRRIDDGIHQLAQLACTPLRLRGADRPTGWHTGVTRVILMLDGTVPEAIERPPDRRRAGRPATRSSWRRPSPAVVITAAPPRRHAGAAGAAAGRPGPRVRGACPKPRPRGSSCTSPAAAATTWNYASSFDCDRRPRGSTASRPPTCTTWNRLPVDAREPEPTRSPTWSRHRLRPALGHLTQRRAGRCCCGRSGPWPVRREGFPFPRRGTAEQHAGREGAHLRQRLADGGQRRRRPAGLRQVVEAHHADVVRNAQAPLPQTLVHPERHLVARREDRGRRVRQAPSARSAPRKPDSW